MTIDHIIVVVIIKSTLLFENLKRQQNFFTIKNFVFVLLFSYLFFSCENPASNKRNNTELTEEKVVAQTGEKFIGTFKAKAMILGVFHFSNPGNDSQKFNNEIDILNSKRQMELDEVINKIAEYKPTKILIEQNRIRSDSLINSIYRKYLKTEYNIEKRSNEIFQLGFKLAKKMGHDTIYCSDAKAPWFGVDLDWDNYDEAEYMKSKKQFKKITRYNYYMDEVLDSVKIESSLNEYFIKINSPNQRLKDHQMYLNYLLEGAGDNYLGADKVGRWYRRNLRIFSNAYDFTTFDKEDRLLLIFGAGHVWQLRQFFIDSPDYDYIEVNNYLKK